MIPRWTGRSCPKGSCMSFDTWESKSCTHSVPFPSFGIAGAVEIVILYFKLFVFIFLNLLIMSLLERSGVGWSVPVPVVPINFLSVPFHLLIYITIYILSSYRVSIKGYCPMKTYLEQLEQLEQLERLPENHFCFDPVTGTPEVPISSRRPRLRFISFHPRRWMISYLCCVFDK